MLLNVYYNSTKGEGGLKHLYPCPFQRTVGRVKPKIDRVLSIGRVKPKIDRVLSI